MHVLPGPELGLDPRYLYYHLYYVTIQRYVVLPARPCSTSCVIGHDSPYQIVEGCHCACCGSLDKPPPYPRGQAHQNSSYLLLVFLITCDVAQSLSILQHCNAVFVQDTCNALFITTRESVQGERGQPTSKLGFVFNICLYIIVRQQRIGWWKE